jgi:hypothetical protein
MAITKKTLFADNLDRYNTFVTDTDPLSKYFKLTELPDTFTGGKNAFLIQGSEYLVADSLIKIELKDSKGDIIYHEPGEGIISASVNGEPIVTEYYEGVSKLVSVYIYPDTAFGPCTITILGELSSYDNNGIDNPIPTNWEGSYNVKWQKQINVVPSLANDTRIRFYKRPTVKITEVLSPIYSIVNDTKVASAVTQSFANIKLSNLETFAGDVKRVKVFRTSIGDISDYDLIQDILVESKELLTSYGLSGSVVGNTGIFTSEVLKNQWNSGSLTAILDSSRVESGVRLTGNGNFRYTQSLDLASANTYELNLDAFYSASTDSNLGIYLVSGSTSSSIATLYGTQPTKNLLDTTIPFKVDRDYPTASLYFSQSQGQWHLGNVSLKLSEDTAFSPDEIGFITTMPTVLGNETFNFKFEFYDINNNYVPVAVTQSATFTGGNTNIGGTILLISSSASSSLADLNRVSSSISGTILINSSSVSASVQSLTGSIITLSGSVSGTIGTLSGSISQSVALNLSSSLSKVKLLADGGYPGTFIESSSIYSPNIAGINGYFSGKFQVGATNPIVLDATTATRKIYIGTGTYNNANTSVYLDSGGQFSLKDKLTWDGTNLSVNGSITITNPSTANNGGKVGGFSNGDALTGGSIAGVTIASTKIYIGTGTFANANTGFYVDSSGQFSLADKLYWNGTTLNIEGNIVITGGSTKTSIDNAAAAASAAQSTADSKITGGQVNANVTSISGGSITTGTVAANRIDVAGVISAGSIIVAGNNISSLTNNSGYQANGDSKTAGFVGGWSIDANSIKGNSPTGGGDGSYTTNNGIILSSAGWISSKKFYIDSSGNASFKGDITGASGTFSGNLSGATITGATGTFAGSITGATGTIGGWSIGTSTISATSGTRTITLNAGTGYVTFSGDAILEFGGNGRIDFSGGGGIQMYSTTLGIGVTRSDNGHRGNLCVGTTECVYADYNGSGWAGYFVGPVAATGTITQNYSDERLKNKISNIPNAVDKIQKLNGFYYTNNDLAKSFGYKDDNIQIGVSAQEVKEVFPELIALAPFDSRSGVSESGENYMTVQYERLVPVLIEAIKELKAEIEELKKNK